MQKTLPSDIDMDKAEFKEIVGRFVDARTCSSHPVFGALSKNQWGILSFKHVDHHLKQFGL